MEASDLVDKIELTDAQRKSRRNRNIAIGLALGALVVIFYAVTIIKMVPGATN
jgi:hypothetical protein